MKNHQISLDAKDLLLVLKMAYGAPPADGWTYERLALRLGMSPSQVHGSAQRLVASGLLAPMGIKGKVNKKGLADFIIHGARYVFPAVFGKVERGIRTGVSSELFQDGLLVKEGQPWVWPSPQGDARGMSLAPIHPSALKAVRQDPELHKALVHFDALRGGMARERMAAEAYFRKTLAWSA